MNNDYATHTPAALGAALLHPRFIMSYHPMQTSDGGVTTVCKRPFAFVAMTRCIETKANGESNTASTAPNGRGASGN